MRTLHVRGAGTGEGHGGEVYSCAYTADGAFVLSAGWDGCLRLWLTSNIQSVSVLRASAKPLSCCTLSPDGTAWLSASMDGVLSWWDAVTHQLKLNFIAHIRPISTIQYAPDGQSLLTASWDRKLVLRKVGKEREGQTLSGHHDIVSGCQWSPDGKQFLSWSHDGTLRLWDANTCREAGRFTGHEDRVTAACFSLDGHWAISGGRDGTVKVWDVQRRAEVRSVRLSAEVRGCYCLFDGLSVVTVNADGWMVLWSLPDFEVRAELASDIKVMCGHLAPSGQEIALGSEDGRIHIVALEGIEEAPILVTPRQTVKPKSGVFGRLLGKPRFERTYQYTCPACRHTGELTSLPSESISCEACKRLLRVSADVQQLQPQ
ncbi:MAG TPA: WD40 repeat domain-containing protein [Gemmataceae bacterium]|nr:WD40 repeat domain-containing protein [Gemmataceae bacterium]